MRLDGKVTNTKIGSDLGLAEAERRWKFLARSSYSFLEETRVSLAANPNQGWPSSCQQFP